MKRFLVSYRLDGNEWNIEVPADDQSDAERRVRQLAFGKVRGEIVAKVPGQFGPIAALVAFVRNQFTRGQKV
ncbi:MULTISPECIES: hypothetical protein [unclassified Sphingomonas]|uniref:hypothetical protein n=1 Tax=unclassified Sphingomonas TaxID=196159 RepID=UPI0006FA38D1|nr:MULTISPECIES: hypothetical protein [unclassified Sphingomonas]KQM60066.1 hypothetical protein ASE65_10190 [Sphingomonas sp. Leaf16]KQN11464.1 hypothetical protein ASE81_11175 [Sphingomonas sp. Leaf29]KQN18786.1 hypothetical protein ASE83_11115 [Sphingomonas sp. Leaf32]